MLSHSWRRSQNSIKIRSVLKTAQSSRIAIDKIIIKINGDWSWVYDAINIDSR